MKLVSSSTSKKVVPASDRTFTLSPEAYAIIKHNADKYGQDETHTLNSIIIMLDALMLDKGMFGARVIETDSKGVVTYCTNIIPTPELGCAQLKSV